MSENESEPQYNPQYYTDEEGEIIEADQYQDDRAAGNGPRVGTRSSARSGSREWIKEKADEMRALAAAKGKKKPVAKQPVIEEEEVPEEDPIIKEFIEKLKTQTILIHQPDTGIIEPKYQGVLPIQTYTPPVIPAVSFTNQESRQEVLRIFRERAAALVEAQGQQKLNTVVGDYIRDNSGNIVNNLKWPKTVILFLTQGLNREEIDGFVANIGYLHGWIKDYAGMMDWIEQLQNKPNEFNVSDIAATNIDATITELKGELRKLRDVLAISSAEVNVEKLSSVGKMIYSKIIRDDVTGIGAAGSNMANLYSSTYRYVAKNILKYTPEEMSHIDDDPLTMEQVYMNYLI
jgi:hypothetical protein